MDAKNIVLFGSLGATEIKNLNRTVPLQPRMCKTLNNPVP